MRNWLAALLCLVALPALAQTGTPSPKATMQTEINTNLPDNAVGSITPAILRTTLSDMLASYQNFPGVRAVVGTTDTTILADYGRLVTYSNGGAIAVTLPQATGSFATFGTYILNLGAGTVTVTPTTSTILGAATLVLTTNQGAAIFSDGTNYQGFRYAQTAAGSGTVTSVTCGTGLSGGAIVGAGTCAVSLGAATNSIGADVLLNNTANYFDGPSTAQGTSGTWLATGTVSLTGGTGDNYYCKLWDGTTVMSSAIAGQEATATGTNIALSGFITNPVANIRISCRDLTTTTGKILFNQTGNSKDSTLSVVRTQ